MTLTLTNKITVARLFSIPFFVLLLIYYDKSVCSDSANPAFRFSAAAIFMLIVLTDALDGYFARKRKEITRLGTFLDPLADKALLLSAIILLSSADSKSYSVDLPAWFVWLVICRDLMIVIGSALIHTYNGAVTVKPRIAGKITTFLQTATIFWMLMDFAPAAFPWLLGMAALFTIISGARYFIDGIRQVTKG